MNFHYDSAVKQLQDMYWKDLISHEDFLYQWDLLYFTVYTF